MSLLKQSSTAQPLVFLMVDSADHLSPKTGLSPTVTLSKNGGTFASPAGAVSEIGSGWYKCAGNATDTGTLGPLILHATATGADPVDVLYEVVAFDPQSATNLGLTNLDAAVSSRSTYAGGAVASVTGNVGGNVTGSVGSVTGNVGGISGVTLPGTVPSLAQITGALPTDSTIAADVQTGLTAQGYTSTRAGYLDTLNGLVQAVWDKATSALTTVGSIGKLIVTNLDAAISSRLASGNVTVGGYASGQDPATLVLDVVASGHNTANTVGAKINSAGSAGDPWSTALPGSYASGTAGNIVGNRLDAAVSSRLAASSYTAPDNASIAAAVNDLVSLLARTDPTTVLTAIKTVTDKLATMINGTPAFTSAALANAPSGSAPTASQVAAAVWDLATSGHTTTGTFGAAMSAAGSAGDPWATSLPGSYGAGTAGSLLTRIAGLAGRNVVLRDLTANANGKATGGTLRVYDTATAAQTDDGTTGLIGSYALTWTYSGVVLTGQKIREVS
jgi:hypothetical protein